VSASNVLLDTHILVYTFEPVDTVRQEKAIRILKKVEEAGSGCLSVQSLSEFASIAIKRKFMSPGEVIKNIDLWRMAFPVYNLTPQIVLVATRGVRDHRFSYYDAQIWACARLNQVPLVLSEDFQHDERVEGVQFINPFLDDSILSQ